MIETIEATNSGYRFIPGVSQYSCGIGALPGFAIERVRFSKVVPLKQWFEKIAEIIKAAGRPLTADEWMHGYTRGKPAAAFARDRLGVLLRLGLAEVRGSDVVMVPGRGRRFALVAGSLRRVFGLPT